MNNKGSHAENVVLQWLIKKRYRFLEKNFSWPYGELDLIMEKDNTLVFIEIRSRLSKQTVDPAETLSFSKKQKIKKTAQYYICMQQLHHHLVRFDFIVLTKNRNSYTIEHYKNAF